jgi:hypothetical protein
MAVLRPRFRFPGAEHNTVPETPGVPFPSPYEGPLRVASFRPAFSPGRHGQPLAKAVA